MTGHYCDTCEMPHSVCARCGAAIVASLYLHRDMNAHGNGPHWCGEDNPGYQATLRAMRISYDESREMLSECPICRDDVIRRANSPVLFDVHGYYGLQGDQAVHDCTRVSQPTPREPAPSIPTYKEGPPPAPTPIRPWRIIP